MKYINFIVKKRKIEILYYSIVVCSIFLPFHFSVSVFTVRLFDILILIGLFINFIKIIEKGTINLKFNIFIFIFILFNISIFVFGLKNSQLNILIKNIIQNFEFLFLLVILINIFKNEETKKIFLKYFIFLLGTLVFFTTLWHINNGFFYRFKMLNELKSTYGLFALFIFPYFLIKKNLKYDLIFIISLILLILSVERKGWIGFIMGALLILYFYKKRNPILYNKKMNKKWLKFIIIILFILILLFILINNNEYLSYRVSSLTEVFNLLTKFDSSINIESVSEVRFITLNYGFKIFLNNPIIGIGEENFKTEIAKYIPENKVKGPHNIFLKYLVENGFIVFSIYFFLYIILLIKIIYIYLNYKYFKLYDFLIAPGLLIYSIVLNLLKGGGAENLLYLILPASVIIGITKTFKNKLI